MTRRVPLLAAVAAVALVALLADAGRNSGGTYAAPAGNPVVTGTTISSTWANNTITDLGTELTNSLDRYGRGPMLAALQHYSGSASSPGASFSAEPSSGLYRNAAGDLRMSVLTNPVQQWTTAGVAVTGTASTTGLATLASLKVPGNVDAMTGTPTTGNTTALTFTGTGTGSGAQFISGGTPGALGVVGSCATNGCSAIVGQAGYVGDIGGQFYATADGGLGVSASGGPNGSGLSATGGPGGYGAVIQGGNGFAGVSVVGGAGAAGVVANGAAGIAGVWASNGTASTSGVRQDALSLRNGDLDFSPTPLPLSTTAITAQRATGNSFAKAWVTANTPGHNILDVSTGPNSVTVLGGLNISGITDRLVNSACNPTVSGSTTETIVVTFATPFAASVYAVSSSLGAYSLAYSGGWGCTKASGSITCTCVVSCAAAPSNVGMPAPPQIDVIAFGAQ